MLTAQRFGGQEWALFRDWVGKDASYPMSIWVDVDRSAIWWARVGTAQ